MKRMPKWVWCLVVMGVTAGLPMVSIAADAGEINKMMRKAERLYFSGKAQEANELLKQAEKGAEAVLESGSEAEKTKVRRLEAKMKKLRANINRKLGGPPPMSTGKSASKPSSASDSGELPSYVTSSIRGVRMSLDNAQEWLDKGNARTAESGLKAAKRQMAKTEKSYAKYLGTDHPEMIALQQRIDDIEAKIAVMQKGEADRKAQAARAAQDAETASADWIPRLQAYIAPKGSRGHDPDRYFTGYTEDPQEMARQNAIYAMILADLKEYRETGPGDNATDELKQVIKNLEYQVSGFEESYAAMGELYLNESNQKIGFLMKRVGEEAEKLGSGGTPNYMSRFALEDARRVLNKAAGLLGEADSRVAALEADYRKVLDENQKLIQARISDTRMTPDQFNGGEKNDIKKTAESVLKTKYPDVSILRTTVISPDWSEENVIEWTDTTKTALQHRITHSVSAQAAGKRGGDIKLYTIHIAKNRRTDGSWGPLHGHIMFEDPMLEENVNR